MQNTTTATTNNVFACQLAFLQRKEKFIEERKKWRKKRK